MKCAGWISERLDLLSKEDVNHLNTTINKLPLPEIEHVDGVHLMPFIKTDKKWEKGILSFVVLEGLGKAAISTNVSEKLIQQSLKVLN